LASSLHELGRDEEACEHYSKASNLDPSLTEARTNEAALRIKLGDPQRAAELCEIVLVFPESTVDFRVLPYPAVF